MDRLEDESLTETYPQHTLYHWNLQVFDFRFSIPWASKRHFPASRTWLMHFLTATTRWQPKPWFLIRGLSVELLFLFPYHERPRMAVCPEVKIKVFKRWEFMPWGHQPLSFSNSTFFFVPQVGSLCLSFILRIENIWYYNIYFEILSHQGFLFLSIAFKLTLPLILRCLKYFRWRGGIETSRPVLWLKVKK